jgi:hypothetical protein
MGVFQLKSVQSKFILGPETYSAYLGGVGAGKTFSGINRTLQILGQPRPVDALEAPRGLIGAESYDVLYDVIYPQWEKIQNAIKWKMGKDSPIAEAQFLRAKRKAVLKNGASVQFRSLDKPNTLRGRELACFHIDEGRNVGRDAWDRLFDRLRQPGYRRAGFVTSTPNGYDWMYDLFHEDSKKRGVHASGEPFQWYNASTDSNASNLPPEYIAELKANLHGAQLEQEFYGRFMGVTEGAVFPEWSRDRFFVPVEYNPQLPLYSCWDFGIGDPGVVIWCQIVEHLVMQDGFPMYIKELRILDSQEMHTNAQGWAAYYHNWLEENTERRQATGNYGDPAGKQRSHGSGTSVIEDLAAAGVTVIPAPKKPADYGIRILKNMLAGDRIKVDFLRGESVEKAFSAHRWKMDKSGKRVGNEPVHDWSSHYISALRYLAASKLTFFPTRGETPEEPLPEAGSVGDAINRLIAQSQPNGYLGPQAGPDRSWRPGQIGA